MNKVLLILLSLSFNLMAAEKGVPQFGRVVDLKGSGFISYKGKTREITKGDTIEVGAEIVIEHHGQVSFTDNADHRFHLGNSSSASICANTLELRSGDLWFQSLNKNDDYKIVTANATVNYQGGEGILSYDSAKGRSQLMVINSMMKLSNLRSPELNLNVAEGHFSFVDNAYEEGAPRDPTPVGEKTYTQLVSLFTGISPMDKNSESVFKDHHKAEPEVGRHIASVDHEEKTAKTVVPAVDEKIIEEYKDTILHSLKKAGTSKKIKSHTVHVDKKKMKPSKLEFHIYGQGTPPAAIAEVKEESVTKSTRAPASVLEQEVPSEVSPYSKNYNNPNKESDKLIDDLKKL